MSDNEIISLEQEQALLECFDVSVLREQHHFIVILARSHKALRAELISEVGERQRLVLERDALLEERKSYSETVQQEYKRLERELAEARATLAKLQKVLEAAKDHTPDSEYERRRMLR